MPRANIYLSEEDLPKWQAIGNKSQFIHTALNGEWNIKLNEDGTISPIDINKPSYFSTEAINELTIAPPEDYA